MVEDGFSGFGFDLGLGLCDCVSQWCFICWFVARVGRDCVSCVKEAVCVRGGCELCESERGRWF